MRSAGFIAISIILLSACLNNNRYRPHYFLRGYDHLEFRNPENFAASPHQFIEWRQLNGVQTYHIKDHSLTLVHKETGEPYTGPIRTFHWYAYNIEALFKEGKIYRMRYWHPNRKLGMDADYIHDIGFVWNQYGFPAISWNSEEMIYKNPSTQRVRQIITDSVTSYYDINGQMTYYSIRTDTAWQSYYPTGTPRFFFPVTPEGIRDGEVKRWYPNGQLRVRGYYKDGEEWGNWTEYDSLGGIIQKVDMTKVR